MVFTPRSKDTIYKSLRDHLKAQLGGLTNFVEGSFNYVWTRDVFAEHLHEYEVALLAAQLSAYPDYAGGPITQDDLDALGITTVTPDEINPYMEDADLDQVGLIAGVERAPGTKATGDVEFTVANDAVTIPANTEVSTQPDSDGNYLSYFTNDDVTPLSGQTTVTASVTAEVVGDEYNVGSGQITYFPSGVPAGVQSVTNPQTITSGTDREKNDSFRGRVKNSIVETSGGGTVKGIEGYIKANVDGVGAVKVSEFKNATPPYADVIVDGGTDTDVQGAIDFAHPSGVQHNLKRPVAYKIRVEMTVEGPSSVSINAVENAVTNYIDSLSLGDDVIRDKVIAKIMAADDEITDITLLSVRVDDEPHTFVAGTNVYALDKPPYDSNEYLKVTDDASNTYVEGTDFQMVDTNADGTLDSIDWSLAGSDPADGATFYIEYGKVDNIAIDPEEIANPSVVNASLQ